MIIRAILMSEKSSKKGAKSMKNINVPVGISNFEKIRQDGYYKEMLEVMKSMLSEEEIRKRKESKLTTRFFPFFYKFNNKL